MLAKATNDVIRKFLNDAQIANANANPAGAIQNAQNAQAASIAKGQAQNAQNAAQLGARNADKAKAANIQRQVNAKAAQDAQNAQNAQAASIAKGQAQNAQAATPTAVKQPAKLQKKSASKPSTGNRVLDKLQQNKREKQPNSGNSKYDVTYDEKGRIASITPKNAQSQPMYDRNGNKIIQGNGTFERRQRQAADQNQQFQNPTGYDIGAVTNQVSQNSQPSVQASQNSQQPAQASGMFGRTYDNRRFNNAMGYLNKTFTGKKVTLDDGSQVDASQYFQDNLNRILKGTNNPKALKFYLRSLQEDMARRGVGNFDISGELLKGTGMTDGGFAKYMWNNRNQFMTQEQRPVISSPKPTGGSGNKKPATTKYGAPLIKGNTMEQNTKMQNRFDPASLSLKFTDNRTTPLTFDSLVREYRQAHKQNNTARMRILNNQMKKLYPDQYQNAQKLNVTGSI